MLNDLRDQLMKVGSISEQDLELGAPIVKSQANPESKAD